MTHIQMGDVVMVHLPTFDKSNSMLKKFQDQTFIIAKKVPVKGYRQSLTDSLFYYELYGAVSDRGTPYGFLPDWIIKL